MMSYWAIVVSGNKKKKSFPCFPILSTKLFLPEGAVVEGGVIPGRDQSVTDAVPRYNNYYSGFTGVTHSVL